MLRKFFVQQMHKPTPLRFGCVMASTIPIVSLPPATNLHVVPRRDFSAKLPADEEETHSDFKSETKSFDTRESQEQIADWVSKNDLVLFMKGNPKMPQCGFSNYVVQVLKFYGVRSYKSVNVLESNEIREGIKQFSNWPTIP